MPYKEKPIQGKVLVRLRNHYGALLPNWLPLPPEGRESFNGRLVLDKHRGVGIGLRNRLYDGLKPLAVRFRVDWRKFSSGTRPAVVEPVQGVTDRFRMNVHAELPIEVLGNSVGCPSSGVFASLRRILLQKPLNFLLDLLVDFRRTALPLPIIESGGSLFVEPIHPLLCLRPGYVVNLRNLWSRIATVAQQNDVGTGGNPTDFLSLHPLQFLVLFLGRFADGSV
nr:hypothetical protein [Salinibacter ruber]